MFFTQGGAALTLGYTLMPLQGWNGYGDFHSGGLRAPAKYCRPFGTNKEEISSLPLNVKLEAKQTRFQVKDAYDGGTHPLTYVRGFDRLKGRPRGVAPT